MKGACDSPVRRMHVADVEEALRFLDDWPMDFDAYCLDGMVA